MYHQGARVLSNPPKRLKLPERQLDKITFSVKQEARRLADANRLKKPWARRWLKENGHWM
jgi:hypothetical protein